jgi:ATP adenylyltransferase
MESGTLWQRVRSTTENAVKTGALLRFPTSETYVEEGSVRYFVRVLESLKRKEEARREQAAPVPAGGGKVDPFLPPETDLVVGDLSGGHIAVLNKYNVLENHLLIVTRRFEDQEMLLTPEDFEALWFCLSEYDSLGFYNGGAEAGASQQHKHLQVVPLPLCGEGPAVPLAPYFKEASDAVPAFPFLHAFRRLSRGHAASAADAVHELWRCYRELLEQVGMGAPVPGTPTRQSRPYCLLVTRDWMLLVPRVKEFFEDISLNSLAYAGSFFVRDRDQLGRLRGAGMMRALASVAVSAR